MRYTATAVGAVIICLAIAAVNPTVANAQEAGSNFNTFCVKCHGPSGKGDGPASATLSTKPRDLTDCARMMKVSDDTEFKVIKLGGAPAGLSKDMPSFGEGLEDPEIKALVAYIRAFCAK